MKTATLVQSNNTRKVHTYYCNGYHFINDVKRLSGYIVKSGKLIERTSGANYVKYCINFIESTN